MKRFISILLAIIMAITSLISFGGCSSNKTSEISVGAWLKLVNEAFGMQSYTTEEPYFSNVKKDDEYFQTIQIAAEWDVIDKTQSIVPTDFLTWHEALVTLVNVGSFVDANYTEDQKIEFAINNFDTSIRKYWMNRTIDLQSATLILATAQEKWAKRKYENNVEKTKFKSDVKNYSEGTSKIENYVYDENNAIVIISKDRQIDLEAGDTFVLPGNASSQGTTAFKASEINSDENNYYIAVNTDLNLYDIAEDIYVEETLKPTIENAIIRDGNGNVLSAGSNVTPQSYTGGSSQISNLLYTNYNEQFENLAVPASEHTFEIGKWEVSLKYNLDGKFDMSATVKTPNLLDVGEESNRKLEGSVKLALSDLEVTNKIDYSWFKLHEASLRVDYTSSANLALTYKDTPINKVVAPRYSNGNGKFLTNLKNTVLKDRKVKDNGAKTIKICSVDIYSIGVARVCLDINLTVSVEGSVSLSITEHGSKGIEYKNNNLRTIKISDKDADAEIKAKIEGTFGIGPALYTIGLKKPIIGVQIKVGAGTTFTYTLHFADSENHLLEESTSSDIMPEADTILDGLDYEADAETIKALAESQGCTYSTVTSGSVKCHLDRCVDVSVYFILKLELTGTSYAADLLGEKIKIFWEIFGDKNAKLFNIHCENGNWSKAFSNISSLGSANKSQCTMKYIPFDSDNNTSDTTNDSNDSNKDTDSILKGDSVVLSEIKATLDIGSKYYIIIQQIPKGYDLSDLTYSSNNEGVIKITDKGVAVATGEGNAVITVQTKDGKYKAYCAVTVLTPQANDITHLSSNGIPIHDLMFV